MKKRVADEIHRGALVRVGEPGACHQQRGSGPPHTSVGQPVHQVEVQIDEPQVVADAVERAPEPRRGAPQPGELPVRRIEHIRYDEQQEPDDVDPAVPVHEQMARDQPDQERPQGDLVG